MLQSTQPYRPPVALPDAAPRLALAHRLTHWLLRYWQAQCHRAEQPGRTVPYY